MMMKLIQMEEASLWVNLSRCETGGPERSPVFSHPWRPAPCLARTEKRISQGARSVPRPKHHLEHTNNSLRKQAHYTEDEEDRSSQKGVWSSPYEVWLIVKANVCWKGGESQNKKANWWSKYPRTLCCSRGKSCNFPFLVFHSESWYVPTLETDILVNTVMAICCYQHHSNVLWWHYWPRFKRRPSS